MAQDLEAKTVDQIEASLDQLPRGLHAIYQRIVSQFESRRQEGVRQNDSLAHVGQPPFNG